MKKKVVQYKLWIFVCTLLGGIFSLVAGQYYYFDTWSTNYPLQQWCDETLNIRANTESHPYGARAWLLRLLFDPLHFSYSTSSLASVLQTDLFLASTQTFLMYTNPSLSPTWVGTGTTILQIDRYNPSSDYIWSNWLYGTLKFVPVYNATDYTWTFAMIYNGDTVKTSLSMIWGTNIIISGHQIPRLTWYYYITQAPCVLDTTAPSVAILVPSWGTKKSHLSGIALTLNENGGDTNVPYVWTGGIPGIGIWTGNSWGLTNQYGVNFDTFQIRVSGNGTGRYFTGGMFSPSWTLSTVANGTTWQFRDKNYTVDISGSELFDYGIEKPITISGNIRDRNNNLRTFSLSFNPAVGPWLIPWSANPAWWATWIGTTVPIQLGIADDWAWVNSWTIRVTIQWIWWTTYWPYIFSWNNLNLSGVRWIANQPDYYITISGHVVFPTSWTIQVSVYAEDMEGNTSSISPYSFWTRPSCGDLGCCNEVYIQTGINIPFLYSGFTLNVSGGLDASFTNSGSTGTLYCGTENQGMDIYRWTEENSWTATHVSYFDLSNLVLSWHNVKAVLSGKTLYLQKIYVPPITWWCIGTCPGGWGGGWWWGTITRDDCELPSLLACANDEGIDNSPSYYDTTCCAAPMTGHGAAECDISYPASYSQEISEAYQRWYNLNITNKCPITEARLDDTIVRKEVAKMMTMFTIQIIGIFPDTHKAWCDEFTDTKYITDEMKFFTKTACQLDLMGLEPDGNTVKKTFEPNDPVNRAMFGTILSRLIYGDVYNVYSGETYQRYEKHLQVLYEDNIMKKIEDPFMLEKRARILLMLKRTDDSNFIEQYRLVAPAHNWALSLLENVW